jgi:hypothetical protein
MMALRWQVALACLALAIHTSEVRVRAHSVRGWETARGSFKQRGPLPQQRVSTWLRGGHANSAANSPMPDVLDGIVLPLMGSLPSNPSLSSVHCGALRRQLCMDVQVGAEANPAAAEVGQFFNLATNPFTFDNDALMAGAPLRSRSGGWNSSLATFSPLVGAIFQP